MGRKLDWEPLQRFGLSLARRLLAKPGLRASLDAMVGQVLGAERTSPDRCADATWQARWLAALFVVNRLRPKRIGVDGLPGSGKSTLARALAEELAMRCVCLDHHQVDSLLDLSAPDTIYEHHRLIRTQNLEQFDALVYLDCPVRVSQQMVLHRRRGGYLVDVLDFARLKRVGDLAFAAARGSEFAVPGTFVHVKLRPPGGFAIREQVARELAARGLTSHGLSLEEMLFLVLENRAQKGILAYVNTAACADEILASFVESIEQR